jgi:hypothetical protein
MRAISCSSHNNKQVVLFLYSIIFSADLEVERLFFAEEEQLLSLTQQDLIAHEVRNEVMEELIRIRRVKVMPSRRLNRQKRAEAEGCSANKAAMGEIGGGINNRGHGIPLGEAGLSEKGEFQLLLREITPSPNPSRRQSLLGRQRA